jgi:hypothetical protein
MEQTTLEKMRQDIDKLNFSNHIVTELLEYRRIDIDKLKKEIYEHKIAIKELECDNKYQNKTINGLRYEISRIKNNQIYKKVIIAIRDLNQMFDLENSSKIPDMTCFDLTCIRREYVDGCHYITESDNEHHMYTDCKIYVLNQFLNELPDEVVNMFKHNFHDTFLDDIKQIINKLNIQNTFTTSMIDRCKNYLTYTYL